MPLSAWFGLQTRPRAAQAWVGVQAQAGQFMVARTDAARRGGRPRVLACRAVAADARLDALRGWWRGGAHRRDSATLLLQGSDYQMLQIQAPAVEPAEYRAAARWQIKHLIDFPSDEAALDCFATPGEGGAAAGGRLQLVVTRQALVTRTVEQWRGAGLKLRAIDIPEMALRNLALLASGSEPCAFLHVGIDDARLLLLWQQELCASRQLPIGGRQLRGQDAEQRQMHIEHLALEVQRSVDAFGRQFSAADLRQLWVSSVHDAPALAEALAAQVSLQVQAYTLADWMDFDAGVLPFDLERGTDHTLAIGAALREEAMA